jgi:4-amino-4-deoxy-L-arabinose transferase-like glycosyltransferase
MVLLFVFLGSLTSGKTPKYLLVYVPFMALSIAYIITHSAFMSKRKKQILYSLLAIYFAAQAFYVANVFNKNYSLTRTNTIILNNIPAGSRVLSHSNLVFGGIQHCHVHSFLTFYWTLHYQSGDTFYNLLNFAHKHNEDYVVVTKFYYKKLWLDEIGFHQLNTGDTLNGYVVSYNDDEIAIFKRQAQLIK